MDLGPPQIALGAQDLKEDIIAFLVNHQMFHDVNFYTQEQWKARGEQYLKKAEFVMTAEGMLYQSFNYGDSKRDKRLYAGFDKLVKDHGYFWEQGHAWSFGFYREESVADADRAWKQR